MLNMDVFLLEDHVQYMLRELKAQQKGGAGGRGKHRKR
jgi:hypothetical protein